MPYALSSKPYDIKSIYLEIELEQHMRKYHNTKKLSTPINWMLRKHIL